MDDEVYALRRTVSEQNRTIELMAAEIARLRAKVCEPHEPMMGGDFVWRCSKCGKWLDENDVRPPFVWK